MAITDGEIALTTESTTRTCFICGGGEFDALTAEYEHCVNCGHEVRRRPEQQTFMINDPLDAQDARKEGKLDQFKNRVLYRCSQPLKRECLLDVGSASGKFLLRNAGLFDKVIGIEVTPAAANFSREVLGLDIRGSVEDVTNKISVATFWHSLEHIPSQVLGGMLDRLSRQMDDNGRIIVSVPNNGSFQYRVFRSSYAFFDVENHVHQFSPKSLRMLLRNHGFVEAASIFSWPYNVFGHIQSVLNILTHSHNYLYYRLKRHSARPSVWRDVINVALLPFAVPVGLVLTVLELAFPERQGVLTLCFEKK